MADARAIIPRLAADRGESLAALSRMLRRNDAYLQQFVQRGSPRRLAEEDLRRLADHFGVSEAVLGGASAAALVEVPYLSVRASAGRGLSAEGEVLVRSEPFAAQVLREAGVALADATIILADGDSMEPTILSGDRLLVDRGDRAVRRAAIHVVRRAGELQVKRVSRRGDVLRLSSDNTAYPPVEVTTTEVEVIGAVKLLLRRPV